MTVTVLIPAMTVGANATIIDNNKETIVPSLSGYLNIADKNDDILAQTTVAIIACGTSAGLPAKNMYAGNYRRFNSTEHSLHQCCK